MQFQLPSNPRRRNPHRRRRSSGDYLVSAAHLSRYNREAVDKAIASSERQGGKVGGRERSLIHRLLKGRHGNPRRKRRAVRRKRRSQNPRSPLFKLLAQRRGGKRLVYLGGVKFAEKGRPVYFKTPEGARTLAKLLKLQFPVLKRYAFAVAGA